MTKEIILGSRPYAGAPVKVTYRGIINDVDFTYEILKQKIVEALSANAALLTDYSILDGIKTSEIECIQDVVCISYMLNLQGIALIITGIPNQMPEEITEGMVTVKVVSPFLSQDSDGFKPSIDFYVDPQTESVQISEIAEVVSDTYLLFNPSIFPVNRIKSIKAQIDDLRKLNYPVEVLDTEIFNLLGNLGFEIHILTNE